MTAEGIKGHWFGPRSAKKILVFFHGTFTVAYIVLLDFFLFFHFAARLLPCPFILLLLGGLNQVPIVKGVSADGRDFQVAAMSLPLRRPILGTLPSCKEG